MKLITQIKYITATYAWLMSIFLIQTGTAEVSFTLMTDGDLATDSGRAFGCAWGDYDGDGWVDLALTDLVANRLYHNDGNGNFTKVTAGSIIEDSPADGWAVWADYDNDGDLDLFMSSFETPDRFYENQGYGSFLRIADGEIVEPGENKWGNSASWGDLDNDGFVDLFVANTHFQANYLYMNNGDGTLSGGSRTELGGYGVSHLSQVSDYNMDGDVDLLVAQSGQMHYRNEDGVLVPDEGPPITRGTWQDIDITTADYDNDRDLDLVVVGFLGNRLYLNDGSGGFTEVLNDAIQNTAVGPSASAAWGDYDNDGKLDLFIARSEFDGVNYPDLLYHNEGNGEFSQVTDIPLVTRIGESWSAAWADFDNDGDLDLIVSDGFNDNAGKPCALYRNDGGNENNWLLVSLEGTVSNASAIGAKVYTTTSNPVAVTQLREITGHNSDLRAHFGLGSATSVDSVQIIWPSGCDQTLTKIPSNQILTMREIPWPHPTINQYCHTGDWMGWLQVEHAPWVWCRNTQCWLYIPENVAESGSGWIYIPSLAEDLDAILAAITRSGGVYIPSLAEDIKALQLIQIDGSNWFDCVDLMKYIYMDYTVSRGWVYLAD